LEKTVAFKGLPDANKRRLSNVSRPTFSKSTPFELYEDLTLPTPKLSLSSESKLRSTLNHIPMADLTINEPPYVGSQHTTINPKYSRNKHHSELSYITDMQPQQAMRRKKSRSEIITEHSSRAQKYDKQDRPQYRHVKDILFDMQDQPEPYIGRRNSSVHLSTRDPLSFSSNLVQKANALTEAASQVFPAPNKDDMYSSYDDLNPNVIRSPADSGYGTNDRRRLSKQPSIPASFMSSSSDSTSTVTTQNIQKNDNFNSTRSQRHLQDHGTTNSKHSLLDNLHFPKKSSTRQKIPFHARYQEWSDQKKEKFASSRIQHPDTLTYNDAALDLAGADSHFSYDDDVDEFGSLPSPNPYPSISSPTPTLKDSNEKSNVFKSGSMGKQKDNRLSNPFYTKSPESRRTMDISKDKLCLFDDTGDLIAQYVSSDMIFVNVSLNWH
jgi:hypothetical protein